MALVARMAYTRHVRSHDKMGLAYASNATQGSSEGVSISKTNDDWTYEKHSRIPIAAFPQYIANETTILTIREVSFPHLSDSFTVSLAGEDAFLVQRQRPALGWRQSIIDTKTGNEILCLKRNFGQLPVSYSCLDPNGARVLDIQGKFSWPLSGAKSSVFLMNTATGKRTELALNGSHRNRHAAIENAETGEVLIEMASDIFEARNILGGRRTYTVTVKAGVDRAIAVAMIIALDARAS